ncbi:HDOD domain-containing protein [Marinobacter nauticus]|uniref:Two-component system response regulator n=1 Tax=Marinobacter nauticus TaxID=2743 RepID=A0A1M2UUD8_MARNT|nr:HDOD domain-containing protein [Marinobacter nauticus]OJS98969.1 two-component system response regulator [Marinobacter nauticus]
MKTLILEDDELVGELLETVVAGIHQGAAVSLARSLSEAQQLLDSDSRYHLYLIDWQLPDGSGLDLVKRVRAGDRDVPIVMVSGRSDRESVLRAAHHGISGYITKPLDVQLLHERLTKLVPAGDSGHGSADEYLKESLNSVVQLPTDIDPIDVLDLIGRQQELSPAQLAERWREDAALTARLLDVANSSSFRRTGKPVESLRDAISNMGVAMALNQALALALDVAGKIDSPDLQAQARAFHDMALQVSREAQKLAIRLGKSPSLFQQAGLLSRLGEMAVLKVLNQFTAEGGSLNGSEVEQCIGQWSQDYGNRLKVQWKLPLSLRDMIGAVHFLPKDSTREDRLVMRAAALIAGGQSDSDECQRLLRRIGLDLKPSTEEPQHGVRS